MDTRWENGIYTVFLCNRIDAVNAPQVEVELLEALKAAEQKEKSELILDAVNLTYISSAGLRALLALSEATKNRIRILNVCHEVYYIFDMTGFTELFDIGRTPREVSVEGCQVIGKGGFGTVYRLGNDKILKLYNSSHTFGEIERERILAREAFVSGIPSVITYDTVRCGDSFGIVFEMLRADTLGHAFASSPDKTEEYVERYVDFVKRLHEIPINSRAFPQLKTTLHNRVPSLASICSEEELTLLHSLIDSIPDSNTLVHGDLHPGNIMLRGKDFILIDLPDSSVGSKVWDVISLFRDLIVGPRNIPEAIEKSTGIPIDQIPGIGRAFFTRYLGARNDAVLQRYFGLLMPLFALNTVLFAGAPSDPSQYVPDDQVKMMMKQAIVPNEELIRQALKMFS